jgi:hypothetical protein
MANELKAKGILVFTRFGHMARYSFGCDRNTRPSSPSRIPSDSAISSTSTGA